jgi:hypothetical protein
VKLPQMIEAGIAGPEIVERNLHAQILQGVEG